MPLAGKLLAEFFGTAFLLACVVGSGIMGMNLSQGNDAIALLANAGATAAILYVLISLLGPISGAHFNPAVTLAMRLHGVLETTQAIAYVLVQLIAAVVGVLLAHAMFGLSLIQPGIHVRTGFAQWLSEGVATFGLIFTILLAQRHRATTIPAMVACYIFAAYWFTASTSFANPAVTLARSITQTFSGIRALDVPAFIAAQLVGAVIGMLVAGSIAKVSKQAHSSAN